MKLMLIHRTPQHVIESRQAYIEERQKVLARHGPNWEFREAALREIKSCEEEIARAQQRLAAGLTGPYCP